MQSQYFYRHTISSKTVLPHDLIQLSQNRVKIVTLQGAGQLSISFKKVTQEETCQINLNFECELDVALFLLYSLHTNSQFIEYVT